MLTFKLHAAAGGRLSSGDFPGVAQLGCYEVEEATRAAYTISGPAHPEAFPGLVGTIEMTGRFRYEDGPAGSPSPASGRVDGWTFYVSNQKIASYAFETDVPFRDFYETLGRMIDAGYTIIGNNAANLLYGGSEGPNEIHGRGGNDVLYGYERDVLYGGRGSDFYEVRSGKNGTTRVVERAGEGEDGVLASASYRLPDNVERLYFERWGDARGYVGQGNALDNLIVGNWGDDRLIGGRGADVLRGEALNGDRDDASDDVLIGGPGADRLFGGKGADEFRYRSLSESTTREPDTIADFGARRDVVNLRRIDADATEAGDQAFAFIGAEAFGGQAGELRFKGGALSGDVDGDGRADLRILMPDVAALDEGAFLL